MKLTHEEKLNKIKNDIEEIGLDIYFIKRKSHGDAYFKQIILNPLREVLALAEKYAEEIHDQIIEDALNGIDQKT